MNVSISQRPFYGMNLRGEKKKKFLEFLTYQALGQIQFKVVESCICGNKDAQKIAHCDRFGFPVGSYLCQRCGLIYLSPRLTEASLPLFYDKLYWGLVVGQENDSEDMLLTTGGEGYGDEMAEFVSQFVSKETNLKIAEIGMGNGQKLLSLASHFQAKGISASLFGCDFSSHAVAAAKQKGIKAFQGDFHQLQNEGPFDIVIMSHVVEHLNNPVEVLKDVSGLLGTEGLLYIEVPGVGELDQKAEYNYDFYLYSVLAHTYCFNRSSLKSVVESAGFEMVKGTEFVRAVFKVNKNKLGAIKPLDSNAKDVADALNRAEERRIQTLKKPKNKIKNLIERITGYEISRS